MTGASYQTGSSFLPYFLSSCRADLIWETSLCVHEPSLAARTVMFGQSCAGHTVCVTILISLWAHSYKASGNYLCKKLFFFHNVLKKSSLIGSPGIFSPEFLFCLIYFLYLFPLNLSKYSINFCL